MVVLLLGSQTWRQAGIYRDEVALFSHIVALNPEARDAHLNLGNALLEADRHEEGLAASRIAVEQRPESADAHSNLGLALSNVERLAEAEESLRPRAGARPAPQERTAEYRGAAQEAGAIRGGSRGMELETARAGREQLRRTVGQPGP